MSRKIYVAGRISGIDYSEAKAVFRHAGELLEARGDIPILPTKITPYVAGKPWEAYMKDCIIELMQCDGIYMLPNWEESRGARLEHSLAKDLNIPIEYGV